MHRPRKRFGQHFLHDANIIDKILRAVGYDDGDSFLEIGPGRGALTIPLLKQCHKLIAVELDRDLVPLLNKAAGGIGELQVINADILKFDIKGLPGENPYRIVGNLPYNISTPLMFHLLASISCIKDMHFMVQKEVAQRIVAGRGDNHYGRLSIMMQQQCDCQYLFDVAPGCFTPPPKVDSAIIRLVPHKQFLYAVEDTDLFYSLVQTAFAQRRKTISNSLKSMLETNVLSECDIDPRARAENLSGHDFARIANSLSNKSKS